MQPDLVMDLILKPIAIARTPFPQKFGIPRQPLLASEARGWLEFSPHFPAFEALDGITAFSHLWLIFGFHAVPTPEKFSPKVRPPRLGGNAKLGVLATRSPFRPNPIGLSVVRFESLERHHSSARVHLSGLDLMDGTPIYDLKPYLPWCDSVPDAHADWAGQSPVSSDHQEVPLYIGKEEVPGMRAHLEASLDRATKEHPRFLALLKQILQHDPRPSYHQSAREYGLSLWNWNVRLERNANSWILVGLKPNHPVSTP